MTVAATSNTARMVVRNGPLLGPVLTRVIGMLAARAQAPIDRLDDALLVADTVAAHGPDHARDGHVTVGLTTSPGTLELTLGALRPDGARGVLADATLPGVGNVLEQIADAVEVRQDDEGELLYVRLGFGA